MIINPSQRIQRDKNERREEKEGVLEQAQRLVKINRQSKFNTEYISEIYCDQAFL